MAKGKKTGGRRPGAINKSTVPAHELAAKLGVNPLEILLMFANGDWEGLGYDNETYVSENAQGATKIGYTIPPELRAKAAGQASDYLYAKLKALELSSPDGEGVEFKIIVEDYGKK